MNVAPDRRSYQAGGMKPESWQDGGPLPGRSPGLIILTETGKFHVSRFLEDLLENNPVYCSLYIDLFIIPIP